MPDPKHTLIVRHPDGTEIFDGKNRVGCLNKFRAWCRDYVSEGYPEMAYNSGNWKRVDALSTVTEVQFKENGNV